MRIIIALLASLLTACGASPPSPLAPAPIVAPAGSQGGAINSFSSLRDTRWAGSATLTDSGRRSTTYPAWLIFEDQAPPDPAHPPPGGITRGAGQIDGSQVLLGAAEDPDPDYARLIRWRLAEGHWTAAGLSGGELTISGPFATGGIVWQLRRVQP